MKEFSGLGIGEAIQIITNSLFDGTQIDVTCSHDGKVVVTAGPLTTKKLKSFNLHGSSAYENVDFILLSKEDAQNIIDMLNEAILKLEDDDHKDDIGVFGEKAISYERLIDRLDGLLYSIDKLERKAKAKVAEKE